MKRNVQAARYQPHYQRLNGSDQYPNPDYHLEIPDNATGNVAIMLFGRSGSGKSRTIERILELNPYSISSPMVKETGEGFTTEGAIYHAVYSNVELFVADTVGFGDGTEKGLYNVFQATLDNINAIDGEKIPLKRIYFVVEPKRDGLNIRGNIQFLKMAFGPRTASEIRFVINKCDTIKSSFQTKEYFDGLADELGQVYREVFSTSLPPRRVLYISAEDCIGQLCDDLVDACHEASIERSSQTQLSRAFEKLKQVGKLKNHLASTPEKLAALILQNKNDLKEYRKQQAAIQNEIEKSEIESSHLRFYRCELNSFWDNDQAKKVFDDFDELQKKCKTVGDYRHRLLIFDFMASCLRQYHPNLGVLLSQRYSQSERDAETSLSNQDTEVASSQIFQVANIGKILDAWRRLEKDYWISVGVSSATAKLKQQHSNLSDSIAQKVHEISELEDILKLKNDCLQYLGLVE